MFDTPWHFRVLSIDFDFFQETDAYTMVSNYPDGVDASTKLSSLIWTGHYVVKPGQKGSILDNVKINEHLYKQMIRVLRNQDDSTTPVLACNSHVHLYDEIIKRFPEHQEEGGELFIDHIDFHHDFENGNTEVDCGNWLGKILEEFPDAHVRWFARELGVDIFKIDPEKLKPYAFNLDDILEQQYDFIFLCRSDNWLPPHLDLYFDDMLEEIYSIFDENVSIESQVYRPRDLSAILGDAKLQGDFIAEQYAKQKASESTTEGDASADSNPTE